MTSADKHQLESCFASAALIRLSRSVAVFCPALSRTEEIGRHPFVRVGNWAQSEVDFPSMCDLMTRQSSLGPGMSDSCATGHPFLNRLHLDPEE